MSEEIEFKLPTEEIELPSKGYLYSEESGLKSGKIEMKYMTAKEEDILTNKSYIEKGNVLDKLMQSLIVSDINYNDLLTCDKDAIMIAARVLGYGKDYTFSYGGEEHTIDLTTLKDKEFDEELFKTGTNEFSFTLPQTKNEVTFKLLTHRDEREIEAEIRGLKKIHKDNSADLSTRLKYIITSVNGNREKATIRKFVDTALLAMDSRALRKEVQRISPGTDLTFFPDDESNGINIPIGISFFWPDFGDNS